MQVEQALFFDKMQSPLGPLTLIANEKSLIALLWNGHWPQWMHSVQMVSDSEHPVLRQAARELEEYFSGTRKTFSVPIQFRGTEFQMRVWQELRRIPFGETLSYGELASRIGSPQACRAVGAANRRNPLGIIVPCHRAIGADGSLTGFAGGMDAKRYLLALESNATEDDSVLPVHHNTALAI